MNKHISGFTKLRDIPRNQEFIRETKRNVIFRLILSEEKFSRADLSRLLGLSRTTVSSIADELKEKGLIEEKRLGVSTRQGGKRPAILGVNDRTVYIVGILLRGAEVDTYLFNLKGTVRRSERIVLRESQIPEEIPAILSNAVERMKACLCESPGARILAVGVSLGGKIDPFSGDVLFSMGYRMENVPLARIMEESCGIATYVEDGPVVAALREHWFGAAKGIRNFVFLRILPFIRAIVYINGEIYQGANFAAGQIGTSPVFRNDGVKEYLCDLVDHDIFGIPALASRFAAGAHAGAGEDGKFSLNALERFIKDVEKDDKIESKIDQLASLVQYVIGTLAACYDPEMIVLDGIPPKSRPELLKKVRAGLDKLLYYVPSHKYCLRFAANANGEPERVLGILCMVLDRLVSVKI